MNCPSCNAEIADSAKFCPECGEKIIRKTLCPECGTEATPGAKFCAECGHKFAEALPKQSAESDSAVQAAVDRVFALFHDTDGNCKNASEADAELIAKAAENGDAHAMFLLGQILSDGCAGFVKDPKASSEWFRKAAEAGDPWGMGFWATTLGGMTNEGSVETDFVAAGEWAEKASKRFETDGRDVVKNGINLAYEFAVAITGAQIAGGQPEFSEAAETAKKLLEEAGETKPDDYPAAEREMIGVAHLVLAMKALADEDSATACDHFEHGATFGNEDCAHYLAQLNEESDDNGVDEDSGEEENANVIPGIKAGYLQEKDGHLAKCGDASALDVTSCRYGTNDGCRHFNFEISVTNKGDKDTGSLKLCFWLCDKDYSGGSLEGFLMCEKEFANDEYYNAIKAGGSFDDFQLMNVERIADPPTGDYRAIITVNELNDDGNWYIVGWTNFQNPQHWNHEGDTVSAPVQGEVAFLKEIPKFQTSDSPRNGQPSKVSIEGSFREGKKKGLFSRGYWDISSYTIRSLRNESPWQTGPLCFQLMLVDEMGGGAETALFTKTMEGLTYKRTNHSFETGRTLWKPAGGGAFTSEAERTSISQYPPIGDSLAANQCFVPESDCGHNIISFFIWEGEFDDIPGLDMPAGMFIHGEMGHSAYIRVLELNADGNFYVVGRTQPCTIEQM